MELPYPQKFSLPSGKLQVSADTLSCVHCLYYIYSVCYLLLPLFRCQIIWSVHIYNFFMIRLHSKFPFYCPYNKFHFYGCPSSLGDDEDVTYPILGENTTMNDYEEMDFVRGRRTTTLSELINYRNQDEFDDNLTLNDLVTKKEEHLTLSATAKHFQSAINQSVSELNRDSGRDHSTFVGDCMKMIRFVADCDDVDKNMMDDFMDDLNVGYDKLLSKLETKRKSKRKRRTSARDKETSETGVGNLKGYETTGKKGKKSRMKSAGYM